MRAFKRLILGAAAGLATTAAAVADHQVPETPAPVIDVVSVRAFTLDQVTSHFWRADMPSYRTGYLMVLKVETDYVEATLRYRLP